MFKRKKCPNCRKYSYSASDIGQWLCPYCGQNIKISSTEENPKKPGDVDAY